MRNNNTPVPSITSESFNNSIITSNYYQLCAEDFMLLDIDDCIKVLIPEKEVEKKIKSALLMPNSSHV